MSSNVNELPSIVATANIFTSEAFMSHAGPPHTYLGMARTLLAGVQVLASVGSNTPVALAFVAAQVTECALKAHLSRSGNDKRLKNPALRHDLKALWQLAYTEGLPLSEKPPAWLVTLSGLHSTPYYIRYSTGVHCLVTPAAEPMATELAAIVELVAHHL